VKTLLLGRPAPEFHRDLLGAFARQEVASQPAVFLLASILAIASLHWAGPWQILVWLAVVAGAKTVLLELCRRYEQESSKPDVDTRSWTRRLVLAEAVCGCTWAGFSLVGISHMGAGPAEYMVSSHMFLFATFVILLAIRLTLTATVPALFWVGTVPMTLALMARLLVLHEAFYGALAAMALGLQIYFMYAAVRLRANVIATLELRAQKDDLIAELEREKVRSDAARRRAEAASAAKSRFLASMSHELRTPLNAILGFSEVMKTEMLGPLENDKYRDYAGSIHDSGAHLLNLINEILDLSRIEAGRYELVESTFHLEDLVGECRQLLRLRCEAKSILVEEDIALDLPLLRADERAVRQICLNLLSNAVKFTPPGSRIVLAVGRAADGGLRLSIEDNGPGIPADELPRVMQAFGQGSLAHRCAEGGTGLGLPIVQSLTDLHSGRFELITSPGAGTRAIVQFPSWRAVAADAKPGARQLAHAV
jgi:two-component system cell cycle sensor histidine kinase PleC